MTAAEEVYALCAALVESGCDCEADSCDMRVTLAESS